MFSPLIATAGEVVQACWQKSAKVRGSGIQVRNPGADKTGYARIPAIGVFESCFERTSGRFQAGLDRPPI